MTLVKFLEKNAENVPQKTAIIYGDRKISYHNLNRTANSIANALVKAGLERGDRIGIMLPRTPELVTGFLAIAKAGGVAAPVNYELPAENVRKLLDSIDAKYLITENNFLGLSKSAVNGLNTSIILTDNIDDDCISWSRLIENGSIENPGIDIGEDETVYLNYTSGSTGNPKGAVTTHANIIFNTKSAIDALGIDSEDVHLCMFASFAHPHEIFARPLYLGGTMVMVDKIYPKSLAKAISTHKVTCMMGLAPMYENLLDMLEHKAYDLSSLKIPESGGMFTRTDLMNRFREKMGVPIIPVWGSTETTGIALANRPGETMANGSAGKPCPSYEVKIVDDHGVEVKCGEIGEMIFKGPAVVKNYFEDGINGQESFKGGWYYSGDLGKRDEEGNYYFVERKKGMMKVAGLKVYPLEIELVLIEHPSIKEVAVIPVKDRLRGEIPRAIIVTVDGAELSKDEVIDFCKARLSHYKLPRSVEIRESLPKIGSGKINKKALQMELA